MRGAICFSAVIVGLAFASVSRADDDEVIAKLRKENAELRQKLAASYAQTNDLQKEMAELLRQPTASQEQMRELLKELRDGMKEKLDALKENLQARQELIKALTELADLQRRMREGKAKSPVITPMATDADAQPKRGQALLQQLEEREKELARLKAQLMVPSPSGALAYRPRRPSWARFFRLLSP